MSDGRKVLCSFDWTDQERVLISGGQYTPYFDNYFSHLFNYGAAIAAPADENWWKQREMARFYAGFYTPVNAEGFLPRPHYLEHFLHLSTSDPQLVAYTPDEKYGRQDRQVRVKFSRYLTKFYGDVYSENEIRDIAARLRATREARQHRIARTADELEWVYTHGPSSCMAYTKERWDLIDETGYRHHPSVVYESPDVELWYLLDPANDQRVTARTLVIPSKQGFIRVYGDIEGIRTALMEHGLWQTVNLEGVRLKAIRLHNDRDNFIMPYVDDMTGNGVAFGRYHEDDNGQWIKICQDGGDRDDLLDCQNQSTARTRSINSCSCPDCGEYYDESELTTVDDGERSVCDGCLDSYRYAYVRCPGGGYTMEYIHEDEVTYSDHLGEYVHDRIIGDLFKYTYDDDLVDANDIVEAYHIRRRRTVLSHDDDEYLVECDDDGEKVIIEGAKFSSEATGKYVLDVNGEVRLASAVVWAWCEPEQLDGDWVSLDETVRDQDGKHYVVESLNDNDISYAYISDGVIRFIDDQEDAA